MNGRDRRICRKLLAETAVMRDLLEGISLAGFMRDERTVRAVSMTLINIGELVKTLTDETRAAHPQIPWRAIAGMRDVSAHKYQTLRREDVYKTCVEDVPFFEKQISDMLKNDPTGVE